MHKRSSCSAAMAALFGVALAGTAARAADDISVEPLWIAAADPTGAGFRTLPALLNLPLGWGIGDAAVLVVQDGPWLDALNQRLSAGLLDEGAAVLELDVNTARGFSPENAHNAPPLTADDLLPDVHAAVLALQRDVGAGLVVAVGRGSGGDAAVRAARPDDGDLPSEASGGLAAAASLGPGPPRFVLGPAATGRGWPVRADLLCRVLSTATAFGADSRGGRLSKAKR